MKKFTFKTEKSTGNYSAFFPNQNIIKLNKKQVGEICDKIPYKIRFTVYKKNILEDRNPNCEWKWITLKKESKTLNEAKQFIKENNDIIQNKYNLYLFDD